MCSATNFVLLLCTLASVGHQTLSLTLVQRWPNLPATMMNSVTNRTECMCRIINSSIRLLSQMTLYPCENLLWRAGDTAGGVDAVAEWHVERRRSPRRSWAVAFDGVVGQSGGLWRDTPLRWFPENRAGSGDRRQGRGTWLISLRAGPFQKPRALDQRPIFGPEKSTKLSEPQIKAPTQYH